MNNLSNKKTDNSMLFLLVLDLILLFLRLVLQCLLARDWSVGVQQ